MNQRGWQWGVLNVAHNPTHLLKLVVSNGAPPTRLEDYPGTQWYLMGCPLQDFPRDLVLSNGVPPTGLENHLQIPSSTQWGFPCKTVAGTHHYSVGHPFRTGRLFPTGLQWGYRPTDPERCPLEACCKDPALGRGREGGKGAITATHMEPRRFCRHLPCSSGWRR